MFLVPADKNDILEFTTEQLCLVPKEVLLCHFGDYVERLWDKLPNRLKTNPKMLTYRACLEHYNQPWQREHIDDPPQFVKVLPIACRSVRRE